MVSVVEGGLDRQPSYTITHGLFIFIFICVSCNTHVTATESLPINGSVFRAVRQQRLSFLASHFWSQVDMSQYLINDGRLRRKILTYLKISRNET
jgi:hypothetical protein